MQGLWEAWPTGKGEQIMVCRGKEVGEKKGKERGERGKMGKEKGKVREGKEKSGRKKEKGEKKVEGKEKRSGGKKKKGKFRISFELQCIWN